MPGPVIYIFRVRPSFDRFYSYYWFAIYVCFRATVSVFVRKRREVPATLIVIEGQTGSIVFNGLKRRLTLFEGKSKEIIRIAA